MRHGEHAVHGINDLPGNGGPARTRHWRPSGRVWHATQRAAIAAALIGLGYGLASVLDRAPLNVADLGVASLASSALACAEGGGGAQKNLLDGHTDEELPEIRPHSDDYWHMTFKRQVEEMINATIAGVRQPWQPDTHACDIARLMCACMLFYCRWQADPVIINERHATCSSYWLGTLWHGA